MKTLKILSIIAAICFFTAFLIGKRWIDLVLGILWVVISILWIFKKDKKQR